MNRQILYFNFLISIVLISFAVPVFSATVYVDNTLPGDCTGGNYSVANRDCSGSSGNGYNTIQKAVTNCSIGDVIQMRGGVYSEINIEPPDTKNGTAWTAGNFTTLMSYPGEWAKIDGTGLNTSAHWSDQAVISRPTGYNTQDSTQYTKYWKFQNFEVTGGRMGILLKGKNLWFRFLYIHDNGRNFSDDLLAGILLPVSQDNIIEFCWIENNGYGMTGNNANILLDSDYRDTSENDYNGLTFDPLVATKNNTIRYNYIAGSEFAIRHKNQQRFGYNNRNPNDMTYKDYGDKIHHNILLNNNITTGQDFAQIYNNITNETININRSGDSPITYNEVVYNNTVISGGTGILVSAGCAGPNGTQYRNYYDDYTGSPLKKTQRPHTWLYNNITSGSGTTGDYPAPYRIIHDMPANEQVVSKTIGSVIYSASMANLFMDRNLVNESTYSSSRVAIMGHNYTGFTGCAYQYKTAVELTSCLSTWGNPGTIWDVDDVAGSELFLGTSGANQYIANGSFQINGSTTVSNGGKGGGHPYLAGVQIPSYIGAVNPSDNAWVSGVLNNVTSLSWLTAQVDEPAWVEGGGAVVVGGPNTVKGFQLQK